MNLISVIVPVYNSEKFIARTINSILSQTYSDFEVLVINDGSTDLSLDVCIKLSDIDSRIRVFDQRNSGVSVARNNGIKNAKGKFIVFVDSDDYIEKNALEILVSNFRNVNSMVIYGFYIQDVKNNISNLKNKGNEIPKVLSKKEFSNNFWKYYDEGLTNSPCNKLYSSSIIKNNNITFPTGIKMGEDIIFNINYFKHINEFRIIDHYLYNYVQYTNQSTKNIHLEISDDMIKFLSEIEAFIDENSSEGIDLQEHNLQLYKHILTALIMPYRTDEISPKHQREYVKKVIVKFKLNFPNFELSSNNKFDYLLIHLINNDNYLLIHYLLTKMYKVRGFLKGIKPTSKKEI
ncbi:glycosyltransferase family 2 protein [Marinilactibacillus sp. XAAS-LB27]|uniref:glycosyltransferase family 2 protein n=1 Tax=Marinilactibacillus sp. XAAS-LB27 TaxID=3114538 RepID=UPI002E1708A3|nr:glycosyltransferase family 2 protein [Marinilactibacillus sp. XAAS-LB27]